MTNYIIDENGYYVEIIDNDNDNLYLGEYQDREFIRTEIMTIKVFEEDSKEIK